MISVTLFGVFHFCRGQDLLETLDAEFPDVPEFAIATFKTTRIGLGQSVETRKNGTLELSANTRFWNLPERTQSFFADRMNGRLGMAYSLHDRLTLGVGVSNLDGILDGYVKYKLVDQRTDGKGSPITLTLFQNTSLRSNPRRGLNASEDFLDKLAYTSQLLIARKFTRNFSLQLSPTYVHRGSNLFAGNPLNHFALGFGARYRVGGHVSITSEYYYLADPPNSFQHFDPFSLGVNWEMTDLLLQFYLCNAGNIAEDAFITQTRNNFNFRDGNLYFGFNATFVLHLRNNAKSK